MNKNDIEEIAGIVVNILDKRNEKRGFELEKQKPFHNSEYSPVIWDELYQLLSEQITPLTNQTISVMLKSDVSDVTSMTRLMYKAGWIRLYKVKDSKAMKHYYDVADNMA